MAIEYKTITIPYFVDGEFSCKVSYLLDLYDRLECSTVLTSDIDWTVSEYLKSHEYIRSYFGISYITRSGKEFFEELSK